MGIKLGVDAIGIAAIVSAIAGVGATTGVGGVIVAASLATDFILLSSKAVYDLTLLVLAVSCTLETGGFTTTTYTLDKSNKLVDKLINFTIVGI